MNSLQPNPSKCLRFEPNFFRREKCKHCGHPWQLHRGVISEADVRLAAGFQLNAEQERIAAEAQVKAKAKAKGQAKRQASRAVEDGWLFDLAQDDGASDGSDGDSDGGFRMFAGQDLDQAPIERRSASSNLHSKPLKVVNLVDLRECNVLCSNGTGSSGSFSTPAASSAPSSARPSSAASLAPAASPAVHGPPQHPFCTPMASKDDVLLEEIQYLRQMLADSNEEKSIQIAIVRDEVAEKQRTIDELTRRSADAEASLRSAHKELDQLRAERCCGGASTGGGRCSSSGLPADVGNRSIQPPSEHLAIGLGIQRLTARPASGELEAMARLAERRRSELEGRNEEIRSHQKLERELRAEIHDAEVRCHSLSTMIASMRADMREVERTSEGLRCQLAEAGAELVDLRARLQRREAPQEATAAVTSEAELVAWEKELHEGLQLALGRVAERRTQLRVAALVDFRDTALCKICYDRPAACALLPCRHHAFCAPCAKRVEQSRDPACPLCRTPVTGIFETFVG